MSLYINYINYEEMLQRFAPELSNLTSNDTPIEDDIYVIEECISDASGEIDGYVGILYDIQYLRKLNNNALKRICADFAFFNLLKRKGIAKDVDRKHYRDIHLHFLSGLRDGTIYLYGAKKTGSWKSNTVSYIFDKEKFTEGTLGDYENFD